MYRSGYGPGMVLLVEWLTTGEIVDTRPMSSQKGSETVQHSSNLFLVWDIRLGGHHV